MMDCLFLFVCTGLLFITIVIMNFLRKKSRGEVVSSISMECLIGKVVVITGTSTGIGKCLVHQLASHGATVVGGCRSAAIQTSGNNEENYNNKELTNDLFLDLSSFESVMNFHRIVSSKFQNVDILINNAAYMGPKKMSSDGNDYCFQVNYLSHFLLTLLFVGTNMDAGIRLLVINVTSDLINRGSPLTQFDVTPLTNIHEFSIVRSYANTKLCMVLFSDELNRRYHGRGVDVLSIHPGRAQSDLQKHWPGLRGMILRLMSSFFLRPTDIAARNIFNLCVCQNVHKLSGEVFYENKVTKEISGCQQRSVENANCLWKLSKMLIKRVIMVEEGSSILRSDDEDI